MSELFSRPTVIVGMSPPSVNGDPPAQAVERGAGRLRLHVGMETTVALRAAHRTRETPGPVPWSVAGRPCAGHPFGPIGVTRPEPAQRIPDVRGISPPQHRTDVGRLVTGARVRRHDPQTRAPGQGPYGCER